MWELTYLAASVVLIIFQHVIMLDIDSIQLKCTAVHGRVHDLNPRAMMREA